MTKTDGKTTNNELATDFELDTDAEDKTEVDVTKADAAAKDNDGDGDGDDESSEEGIAPKDEDGVPYCRKHHCRMKYSSGGKKGSATKYYQCPVAKCPEKAQIIRTPKVSVVPPQPLKCPRCSKGKRSVFCERDANLSTPASVILRCPKCTWKSNAMAVPALAAQHLMHRPSAEVAEIGDR